MAMRPRGVAVLARLPTVESRIFGKGRLQNSSIQPSLIRFKDRENYNGHHIIKRYTCNDHQRCHACVSVKILDNSDAKDCGTAAVGCLDKLAPDIGWMEEAGQEYGNYDTD